MTTAELKNNYVHTDRRMMQKFVPDSAERMLDVGCNTGGFGAALKASRALEVWGVEPNVGAAEYASTFLDHVVTDMFTQSTRVPDNYFDVVVFNDVLEHIVDPWEALQIASKKLRAGGCVVASLPNILHQDNLLHMLREKDFRYEPIGIRDRTHLRFFTRKSSIRLFEESGFRVSAVEGVNEDWWSPNLMRRLIYKIFGKQLEETKYIQYAIVAFPHKHE